VNKKETKQNNIKITKSSKTQKDLLDYLKQFFIKTLSEVKALPNPIL